MMDPMKRKDWHDASTLVNRLRGIYGVPINDGGGLIGGDNETPTEMIYTRTFDQSMMPQTPIMHEAALRIEDLEAEVRALEVEVRTLRENT